MGKWIQWWGLHLVPGFHHKFNDWFKSRTFTTKPGEDSGFHFKVYDNTDMKYVHSPLRIPMPAGSLAIWDKRLAHGSVPNKSSNGRIIQFLLVRPKDNLPDNTYKLRTKVLQNIFNQIDFNKHLVPNHIFW